MINALASLFGAQSFKHGIHPQGHKEGTEHLRVERMPFFNPPRKTALMGEEPS